MQLLFLIVFLLCIFDEFELRDCTILSIFSFIQLVSRLIQQSSLQQLLNPSVCLWLTINFDVSLAKQITVILSKLGHSLWKGSGDSSILWIHLYYCITSFKTWCLVQQDHLSCSNRDFDLKWIKCHTACYLVFQLLMIYLHEKAQYKGHSQYYLRSYMAMVACTK